MPGPKLVIALSAAGLLAAQLPQNPSPMVEHTRAHARLRRVETGGTRAKLSLGALLVLPGGESRRTIPLVVHFHGESWLPELSVHRLRRPAAVLSAHLGVGSAVYTAPFSDPGRFSSWLEEAAQAAGGGAKRFHPIVLAGFSAGCAAIREILRHRQNWPLIDAIVLADGVHTGYESGSRPGPLETGALAPLVDFARQAAAGRKQMILTHSEVFPGTFASTTETADYLLASLNLKRRAVLKWGPLGMQQTGEVKAGRFLLLGFAGNSAPDHLDHLHALEHWLRRVRSAPNGRGSAGPPAAPD